MKDQVTTIEQGLRLMELGIPAEKASMVWTKSHRGHDLHTNDSVLDPRDGIPAYTVANLMGMMPSHVPYPNKTLPFIKQLKMSTEGTTEFQFFINKFKSGEWEVGYLSRGDVNVDGMWYDSAKQGCLIDALVDRIEWLVSNGYKLEV